MVNTAEPATTAVGGSQTNSSPIWQAALERYFAETRKRGIKDAAIENDLWDVQTPEDLLSRIETTVPPETKSSTS